MSNSALLVGINKYQSDGVSNLHGCCNDVDNVYSILIDTIKTFKPSDITVLKDEEATKENIVGCLKDLVKRLDQGSFGFFSNSGHGSQVVDISGDEADGKDELICPHDMDWARGTYITDDELRNIFSGIHDGAWLEVILDTCHSGTATRGSMVRSIHSPAVDMDLPVKRMVRSVEKVRNHVLWAGCEDGQTSSDAYLGGKYNGAFTYFWAKALRDNPKMLRHKLLQKIRKSLSLSSFDQIPQLTVS